jgi:sugar lactone lactonase YvrE
VDETELLVDARAGLAEGPIWDTQRGELLWIDQLVGTVNRSTGTTVSVVRSPGPAASAVCRRMAMAA